MSETDIPESEAATHGAAKPKGKDRLWWAVVIVCALFAVVVIIRLIVGGLEVQVRPAAISYPSQILTVPSSAIVQKDRATVVFIEANGRVGETQVTIGRKTESDVEVIAGLKQGDRVVIDPPKGLPSGARVTVKAEIK